MRTSIKPIILFLWLALPLQGQIYMDMAMDSSMTFEQIVEEGEAFFDDYGKGQHTGYKAFERWKYWMKRCLNEEGIMLAGANSNESFTNFRNTTTSPIQPVWTDLGPTQSGNTTGWSSHLGRISAISIDDNDADHIIVGTPTGGVWETYDCGGNWVPIYDSQANLAIYSLAINPHNPSHYLVGTWGAGIQQSFDGGNTWSRTGSIPNLTRIVDIKVNPVDPNIILAVNEGGNMFQSRDGGKIFFNTLVHNGTLYDIEFKPGSATIVYASGLNAVYKSFDGGWSFSQLIGPWQSSGFNYNPLMMSVTEDDPDYLYVLEADNGGFGALYLSTNSGTTFQTQSHNKTLDNNIMGYDKKFRGGQAPRDMDIAVSPTDKNEVHVGGVMSFRSFDAGANWTQTTHWLTYDPLPFIHADIDIMCYKHGRLYFGTDGGIFISDDKANSFQDKTTGLSIRQFYRIEISADGDLLVGGSQDNGAGYYKESTGWVDFIGADGMEPIIDKDDPNQIYASIQYGFLYKTNDGGETIAGGVISSPGRGDWVTPIVQDPVLPNTLYQGKQQVHKTIDGALSWFPISNFVMNYATDTIMQEMDISPIDNKYIIVGFQKQAFKTIDGGQTWTDISPDNGFSNINYISIHPHDKNFITMTLSGTSDRVVESHDGGLTWQSIMGNLPNLAAEAILYEGGPMNGIYVAMDPGVYYKNINHPDWMLITGGTPNVLVSELAISGCDLYAATFGRGVWKTQLIDDSMVFMDNDGDGYGDANNPMSYCEAGSGFLTIGGDCNDSDAGINPASIEQCNNLDDDCDGLIDGADPNNIGTQRWYADHDDDGFGDPAVAIDTCGVPDNYVQNRLDCDDSNPEVNPEASEICDGVDNNCNTEIDEVNQSGSGTQIWYVDADGDGFGSAIMTINDCTQPLGYVNNALDCDDARAHINPDSEEICDGMDNNCDNLIDDEDPNISNMAIWYFDNDGDGFGNNNITLNSCLLPDGYSAEGNDCDDTNPAIHPEADEICDKIDNNCNDLIDAEEDSSVVLKSWYKDQDNDGYGAAGTLVIDCAQPVGYVANSKDCDDTNENVYPSAIEICDGVDNNCDGLTDGEDTENVTLLSWYADRDLDGYGDSSSLTLNCTAPDGYVAIAGDCDDTNENIHPEAEEVCDGLDNNCNGLTDAQEGTTMQLENFYADVDGDGYGDPDVLQASCTQPTGYVTNALDCDDTNNNIHPDAREICDGVDNNCNGLTDDEDASQITLNTWYADKDGDGYGDASTQKLSCFLPLGYVDNDLDCDDNDGAIYPTAEEICDGKDNNCDGLIDGEDSDNILLLSFFLDGDEDGYGNATISVIDCAPPEGYVDNGSDCDDTNPDIHPGATEICDGIDNNCNDLVDNEEVEMKELQIWYADLDSDGFGDPNQTINSCDEVAGYVSNALDCNDSNPMVNPDADERCDGIDNNCNGLLDAEDPENKEVRTLYADLDDDGYGDPDNTIVSCKYPVGYVTNSNDCDDNNTNINPDVEELCDGLDNNCDGLTDNEDPLVNGEITWYEDNDSDGFGNPNVSLQSCSKPDGYVLDNSDCDDTDNTIYELAPEVCDGKDNDCDGLIDGEDPDNAGIQLWYADNDSDGYGYANEYVASCEQPIGYVVNDLDCQDNDASIHPSAEERCNNIDDNCDGRIDDEDPSVLGRVWYADYDGDGYGLESEKIYACNRPANYTETSGDCDDDDPNINAESIEACDGIDNNCDGVIDENCDLLDCDGNLLFLHNSLKEVYNAGVNITSDAVLENNGLSQTYNAGSSIDLLPGFEVKMGKQFQANIKPCFNGVSPVVGSLSNELTIMNQDVNSRITRGELVNIKIWDVIKSKYYRIIFSKDKIGLENILAQLPLGRYVITIESPSLQWNREFEVVGSE